MDTGTLNESAMRMVRKLLAAAHVAEVSTDPAYHDTVWADALGARAANILAGVVYRNERTPRLFPVRAT